MEMATCSLPSSLSARCPFGAVPWHRIGAECLALADRGDVRGKIPSRRHRTRSQGRRNRPYDHGADAGTVPSDFARYDHGADAATVPRDFAPRARATTRASPASRRLLSVHRQRLAERSVRD